jgi:pimeloyl-ACP methyl ester carboxylesterase
MQPHWKEHDLVVDGIKIHYIRTGDGSKPPVVLAHGFSDNGLCWLPVALDLEAEYDVILPDARGHGKSARVQPGEAIDAPADLAGLIRGLGLHKPVVGGHSMGGSVSSTMQAHYPGLAGALILEDPAWFTPPPPTSEGEQRQPPRRPNVEWLLEAREKPIEAVMAKCRADNPTWPEVELRPWAVSKQEFDLNFLQVAALPRGDWRDVAKALDCPTLLVTAVKRKGAIVSKADAALAKSLNPLIQIAYIPKAGHSIRRENYPAYIAALKKFLAKVRR